MALNTGISCAFSQAIKGFCRIERPWVLDARITPLSDALSTATDSSFPSGHTVRSGAAYGIWGMELIRQKGKTGFKAGAACVLLFLLIAFSRNYAGVHSPQDVLVGIGIVALDYYLLNFAMCWVDRGGLRDVIFCAAACILVFLPMLWLGCLSNAGSCFGFFLGWLLQRRFVPFSIPVSLEKKIERGVPGLVGIMLVSKAFQSVLSGLMAGKYASFFASFFLSLFIMALFPALFSWKGKKSAAVILFTALAFLLPLGVRVAEGEENTTQEKQIMVIGHRGFAAAAPENTLPAFEKALVQGVDYIELDVQLSADRQIVVCHDANLLRVTGVDAELSSLTLVELKRLDFGKWFSSEYSGTTIPVLAEVLELIRESDLKVYLELKDIGGGDSQFPLDVLNLTREMGMEGRCVFASFQYAYLQTIKTEDPNAKVLLNTTIAETTLSEDYPSDYYGIYYPSFSAEQANAIHEKGSVVFVWTVDDAAQMEAVIAAGADGICSNCPNVVQDYLNLR